jgi:hypothetical protein
MISFNKDLFCRNRKGVVEVVTLVLMIGVVILVGSYVYRWGIGFTNVNLNDDIVEKSDLKISFSDANTLYVRSMAPVNFNYTSVKINGVDCNITGEIKAHNLTKVDLDYCLYRVNEGIKEITFNTPKGVFSISDYLDSRILQGFIVQYKNSVTCDIGFTKIYGMGATSNAHVEVPSSGLYTYSLCLKHVEYPLSNACSGTFGRMFYLDGTTNAHVYTDNSSAYGSVLDWEQACISVLGGASEIDVVYNSSDMSSLGYSCIGSLEIDNTYGGHVGSCSEYSQDIWVNVN